MHRVCPVLTGGRLEISIMRVQIAINNCQIAESHARIFQEEKEI